MNRQYESLRQVIDSKHERIKDLAKSRAENTAGQPENAAAASMSESRTAYALSLYSKISNITWNNDDSENITGCKSIWRTIVCMPLFIVFIINLFLDIANENTKEFKSFSISKEASSFDVANSLWEMIAENNA